MVDDRGAPTNEDVVLELRIHGVNNTTPAAMLDLDPDKVDEVLGDTYAGFWRPKDPRGAPGEEDRGRVPPGITREAYSWGGLARMTPGGDVGALGKAIGVLSTIGWTLLLPFGLANVAYWSRRVEDRPVRSGAWTLRVAGLVLTAFMVVALCELSLDLVATQCYDEGERVCGRLPGWFDSLAAHSLAVRLAALSLVPVVVLCGLWYLSVVTRARYERVVGNYQVRQSPAAVVGSPLQGPSFWAGDRMVGALAHCHLATGFGVVALALGWPALFGTGPDCASVDVLATAECRDQAWGRGTESWIIGACVIGSVAVLLLALFVTVRRATDAPDLPDRPRRGTSLLLGTAVLVLLGTGVAMVSVRPVLETGEGVVEPLQSGQSALLGVSTLPTAVLAVLLGLVLWAMLLRLGSGLSWLGAGAGLLLAASVLLTQWSEFAWLGACVALAVVAAVVCLRRLVGGRETTYQAWAGTAPGMFLGAAVVAAGLLSSLLVLGLGDWLNGTKGARTLLPKADATPVAPDLLDVCGNPCPAPDPLLTVPLPYVLLGIATLVALVVVVLALLTAYVVGRHVPPAGEPGAHGVRRSRRFARAAHRAEKLFGLLVLMGLALTVAAVALSASGRLEYADSRGGAVAWQRVVDLGTVGLALMAAALVSALAKGAGSGKKRPLGLIWDLVCFLPRAAHPFGPPCYAERAVPELTDRIEWWLDTTPDEKTGAVPAVVGDSRRRGDAVVLSAHSLGGVLAVAGILRMDAGGSARLRHVSLLTYGSQLRAYFSRIFPELLGPHVLGVPAVRSASLWAGDPWGSASRAEPAAVAPDGSVSRLLAVTPDDAGAQARWRNLWRPTDYLGFPVWSFARSDNRVDRTAREIDMTSYLVEVLTHGNYPRTEQYREELLGLRGPGTGTPASTRNPPHSGTPAAELQGLVGRIRHWLARFFRLFVDRNR